MPGARKNEMMKNDLVFDPKKSGNSRAQAGAFSALHMALLASLVVIAAGAAYFFALGPDQDATQDTDKQVSAGETPVALPEPTMTEQAPAPIAEETLPEPTESLPPEPETPTLPLLNESDNTVRDALAAIPLGPPGQQYLLSSNIIERSSSALYLMAQGDVPYKLIPIARPKIPFPISDDGLKVTADPAGFSRYDTLSGWLRQLDIAAVFDALDWLLPLFREAWSFYGETTETFDSAVLNTLDTIINTPEIDLAEARLIRKEAVWIYEDPTIEALSPLQKQIMRMGPDNALIVKAVAGQTRDIWLVAMSTE